MKKNSSRNDNNSYNMDKDFSLAFKKWDSYIEKQHLKGDSLQDLEETLYFSKKNFVNYFLMIKSMINRNSSYVSNYEILSKEVEELKKKIINKDFMQGIIKDQLAMKQGNVDFITPDDEYISLVDEVTDIFRGIQKDFAIRGLNPEIEEIDNSIQKENNRQVREVMKTIVLINDK